MLLNILLGVVVVIFFFAAFLLLRAVTFAQPSPPVEPVDLLDIDLEEIAGRLAEIVRCETVSMVEPDPQRAQAFAGLREVLQHLYPYIHKKLELQLFKEHAMLFTWHGSDLELAPVVLMAHYDVVPVSPDSLNQWEHPPFSGDIADDYVWGRGTLDDKGQMVGILEAVEELVMLGYQPKRTFYLAFGHDEEIGGSGQQAFVEYFKNANILPWVVLDEGGMILGKGMLPAVDSPVAMVGTAEKGSVTLELKVESLPSHSSMPPRQTPIGILARAVAFLEHDQMPVHMEHTEKMFRGIGAALNFPFQFVLANRWLFGGMIQKRMEASPATNASIRSTTAPTIFHSGIRENVLPDVAMAHVNFRIMPGETVTDIYEHARKVISDERVKVAIFKEMYSDPTLPSPTDVPSYQMLARTIRQVFDNLPVAPYLVVGATDARHYRDVCEQVYRFTPVLSYPEDLTRVHGLNERVHVEALGQMVQFYAQLIKAWGEEFKI